MEPVCNFVYLFAKTESYHIQCLQEPEPKRQKTDKSKRPGSWFKRYTLYRIYYWRTFGTRKSTFTSRKNGVGGGGKGRWENALPKPQWQFEKKFDFTGFSGRCGANESIINKVESDFPTKVWKKCTHTYTHTCLHLWCCALE